MAGVPQDGIDTRQAMEAEILVQKLLSTLGTLDGTCLTLAYAAGMSHSEISGIVDLPIGSVKSRIHRDKELGSKLPSFTVTPTDCTSLHACPARQVGFERTF